MKKPQTVLLGIIVALVLAAAGYYYLSFANKVTTGPTATSTNLTSTSTEEAAAAEKNSVKNSSDLGTAGWTLHKASEGFSFEVPSSWRQRDTYWFSAQANSEAMSVSVDILPINKLRVAEDPSAEVMYDPVKKQWISIRCKDFSMSTNCREAKEVTTKVVTSNTNVGGVEAYAFLNQSPAVYIVPINSMYGLMIMVSPAIEGLNPTLKQILSSFRFTEPSN